MKGTAHTDGTSLAALRDSGVQIFGAGQFARSVARVLQERGVQVHRFLVSQVPGAAIVDGIACDSVSSVALDSGPTWIAVHNHHPASDAGVLSHVLRGLSPNAQLVWPQQYYALLAAELGWRFWLHPIADYGVISDRIASGRALLHDEVSQRNFDAVLAFRTALTDPVGPQPDGEVTYLPRWFQRHLALPLHFVDAGAYHGETTLQFASLVPLKTAYAFEPDPVNHEQMLRAFEISNLDVKSYRAGVGAASGSVCFAGGAGEASHVSATGGTRVPVVALSEALTAVPINFIKLDVEGQERPALEGARDLIEAQRPLLAIAGYHRWDDLWEIPHLIASFGRDYRISLGVHKYNTFDLVFYAH